MSFLGRRSPHVLSLLLIVAAGAGLIGSGAALTGLMAGHHGGRTTSSRVDILRAYGRMPLSFQPNVGQTDSQVRFLAHGAGYGLYLTRHDATIVLDRSAPPALSAFDRVGLRAHPDSSEAVLRIAFIGANPEPHLNGTGELTGKTNYLIGNDPAAWHTGVANYSGVDYRDLYPGVSLQFSVISSRLEYTFSLAPAADPAVIQLAFTGQRGLAVDPSGNLIVRLHGGQVVEDRPFVYQTVADGRHEVPGRFDLQAGGRVGFAVGAYDHSRTLFIDPVLTYSTYLGGTSDESAFGVQVDASGAAYVTGFTSSANFPHTAGSFRGVFDVFVTKLNSAGSGIIYSTFLGGSRDDEGSSIAVDPTGRAYVTGFTNSPNFPTTSGAFDRTFNGVYDAYLTKLNPTGSGLNYSTFLGGSADDDGIGVTLDQSGTDPFVTGTTFSKNFPHSLSAYQKVNRGGYDAFVTKVDPNPSKPLLYSTYLGGNHNDVGVALVASDSAGRVIVSGGTGSSTYPTTFGAFDRTYNGGPFDAVLTKLNPLGSGLNYSTYLGGSKDDEGEGVATDASGNAYVSGGTSSTTYPTTAGAYDRTYNGGPYDAFVTKVDPNPNHALAYSTFIGGSGLDFANLMAVDPSGDAHVVGATGSSNFPTVGSPYQPTYGGGTDDGFVTELKPSGGGLVYSSFLGGSDHDGAIGIALDSSVNEYVVGDTSSSNFPTAGSPYQASLKGGSDAFVTKIAPGPRSRR